MKNFKYTLLSITLFFTFSCTRVTSTAESDCFYRHVVFNSGYDRSGDPFNPNIYGNDGILDGKWQVHINHLNEDEYGEVNYNPPATFPAPFPNSKWLIAKHPFAGGGRDHVYYYTFCLTDEEYNSFGQDINIEIQGYILGISGGTSIMPAVQEVSINNVSLYNNTSGTYGRSVSVTIPKSRISSGDINTLKIELNTAARAFFDGTALNVSGHITVINCCN